MNYSLFIMVLKEMVSMEVKWQPEAASTSYYLLSFAVCRYVLCIHVSPPPHREIAQGSFYSCFLVKKVPSSQSLHRLDPRGGDGPHQLAIFIGREVGVLHLMIFPVDFLFSWSFISKKMMWQKAWVRLTSRMSRKVKNMQK
jgi:hypothetical protein